MSQQKKLLDRLKRKPKDFAWSELVNLLASVGYEQEKNTGSRRKFFNESTGALISLHEPHPKGILKMYQLNAVLEHLKKGNFL